MTKQLLLFCIFLLTASITLANNDKQRLIILADMGNEPDEEQQMVHMLHNVNEFEVEGLIAVTGKYLRKDPQPELFFMLLEGYANVVDNFKKHAEGFPEASELQAVVAAGQNRYGIADVEQGAKSSPGSKLIEKALAREDPRPIYVVVNAGANTLAQALLDYEAKVNEKKFNQAVAKLRVFENGSQDNAGAWINARYPAIHWVRSNYQTYAYGGPSIDGAKDNSGNKMELGPYTWEPYAYSNIGQHQWALEHVKGNHGPLAKMWPIRQFRRGGISFLEGGGTIPWLALVNKGLYEINNPHWGGWAGRYTRTKVKNYWSKHSDIKVDEVEVAPFFVFGEESETWVNPEDGKEFKDSLYAPVWRWRRAFFNNQKARADWGLNSFKEANHHPIAVLNGDDSNEIVIKKIKAGKSLKFDASKSSDPDGDNIIYSWWIYKEAGTYQGNINIEKSSENKITFTAPKDAKNKQIHLILEIKDDNKIAELYDYRRIVLNVK